MSRSIAVSIAALILLSAFFIYARSNRNPVLFSFGADPELPGGRILTVMNPFRQTSLEDAAEKLIHDLRSGDCEQILAKNNIRRGRMVCEMVKGSRSEREVWREDQSRECLLIYDLPDKGARLLVYFYRDEVGLTVGAISSIQ